MKFKCGCSLSLGVEIPCAELKTLRCEIEGLRQVKRGFWNITREELLRNGSRLGELLAEIYVHKIEIRKEISLETLSWSKIGR